MNFDKKDKIEIFENAISWIVVFALFVYGGSKIFQFDSSTEIDKTVSELTGMQLMWAFYGYSKAYAVTLGMFEIIGGILILIKRTRLIGCLFVSTILINVILQDVLFEVHVGALKAALFYQFLILVVLWINKNKLILSIQILLYYNTNKNATKKLLVQFFIAFVLFLIIRILEYFITIKY